MHNVSVIVPVLNELSVLKQNFEHYLEIQNQFREIIFVDGGSTDESFAFLKQHFSQVYTSPEGRAKQMNIGAKLASGKLVLFLHADSILPLEKISNSIEEALWGFFFVKLSGKKWIFRLIEKGINFRSWVFKIATGDQCLFFDRKYFLEQGGFVDQPLMEDVEIARRFKKNYSPSMISAPIITSSRRWERQGVLYTILAMWAIQLMYKIGVSPERLARWYGKS